MKYILSTIMMLFCVFAASAQNSSLSGQITDAHGAVIAGTKVKAIAKDKTEFNSDADKYGIYALKMPGGSYRIEFTLKGCKDFVIPEYVLDSGTHAVLDAEIPMADCRQGDDSGSDNTGDNESYAPSSEISMQNSFAETAAKPAQPAAKNRKRIKL